MTEPPELYKKYYIDREYEQVDLFRMIRREFGIRTAVYPGSYVHISPSFIFPETVYIDTDSKAVTFFKSGQLQSYVEKRKEYSERPDIRFFDSDYREIIPELVNRFQLMISQYAGFISEYCKPYLEPGGILLVNNSHADAGLASLDPDYTFIAAVRKTADTYRISYTALNEYFIPKKEIDVTREYLHSIKKGVGYRKAVPLYIFRKI